MNLTICLIILGIWGSITLIGIFSTQKEEIKRHLFVDIICEIEHILESINKNRKDDK